MDRRTFLSILGAAAAVYVVPGNSRAGSSRHSLEDSLSVDPIEVQRAESLAAAVENDGDSFDIGRRFLESLHDPPLEGLQKILLEYEFSTRYKVIGVGLPLSGRATVEMEKKNGGYEVTAKIKKMGGVSYRIGQFISFLHIKKLPNVDYEIKSKMKFEGGTFVPVWFRKNDKENHAEEELEFRQGFVLYKPAGTRHGYHGEPDPFSRFFSYLLLDTKDVSSGRIINLAKDVGVDFTEVETVREQVSVDDKTYTHRMIVGSNFLDMVEGGVSFSKVDDGKRRIPVRAYVPRFKVDHGEYEIKIKLKSAIPIYS